MRILLTLGLLSCIFILTAQDAAKINAAKEIVWYGLDFTKTKFIGDIGSKPEIIKEKHMASWNRLVATEKDNFDLKDAVGKEIYYDLNAVMQNNATTDVSQMETFNAYDGSLEKSALEEIIKKYAPGDKKEGVGLVFIVTKVDKLEKLSTVYAVFFDIASGTILASKKFNGKADGIGFRNFWAGTWKAIINKMDTKYSSWK